MQLDEIGDSIAARRNRIFLLMEEVRRLRIQQRLKVRRRPGGACRGVDWGWGCGAGSRWGAVWGWGGRSLPSGSSPKGQECFCDRP
jgi:hypothetical protein